MALMLMLRDWCVEHHLSLTALHVDHCLRPESTDEAQQVQQWMEMHGIPCHILTITESLRDTANLQAAARDARYRLMIDWCHAHDVMHLCVAHHAEDQMETFLMRLGRGSGVDGLAAMRPVSQREGVALLRPVLHMHRAELEDYLKQQGQAWLDDPTNDSPAYTRNRVRQLLPALEAEGITVERIGSVTDHLARAADCLNGLTQDWISTQSCFRHEAFAIVPTAAFQALHEELALRVLRRLLETLRPNAKALRFERLYPVMRAMHSPASFRRRTLHGCVVIKKAAHYYIAREPARLPPPVAMQQYWDDRFKAGHDIRHQKCMLGMLGADGVQQLRQASVALPDWPATVFHGLPALYHLDALLAVPHIDYVSQTWHEWGGGELPRLHCRHINHQEYLPICPI